MIICLGSTSPIKKAAIEAVWPEAIVKTFEVDSQVPEQPVGKNQTMLGAKNRCRNAFKKSENFQTTLIVGIENGIWTQPPPTLPSVDYELRLEVDEVWVDGAAISVLRVEDDNTSEFWSDVIYIPKTFKEGPNGIWSHLKDPHLELSGKSRQTYIQEALELVKEELFPCKKRRT
jgi:hypothetical protein